MKHLIIAGLLCASSSAVLAEGSWRKTESGVVVTPARSPAKAVRLQVYGDQIVRVTEVPSRNLDLPASLMVTARPLPGSFAVSAADGLVTLKTAKVSADVDLATGLVRFRDAAGRVLLAESGPPSFTPVTEEGQNFLAVRQQFNRGTDEALYGLGQHQNAQMNYLGEDVELAQHNMDVAVPFLVSTRNYGLLWDNNSITRFGNPKPYAFAGPDLAVTGENGQPGFTARYLLGGKLALVRQEPVINYQYIRDQANFPAAAKPPQGATGAAAKQKVIWSGTLHPSVTGVHKLQLYASSYFRLIVDGRELLDRWRQNWNPWYHNVDVPMTAGRPVDIRIEWEPNGGYIGLFHSDPLPPADRKSISFASELGQGVDYYFVGGRDMDEVISGYRTLTGKAVMMPKWAYGFWQSRQRYTNQTELVNVVEQYRRRRLPLDTIVQDWFYWPEAEWGSHKFDPARYPDPGFMVERVHALNARLMISIWPKFYPTTDNYRELAARGHAYQGNLKAANKDWVGPGYASTFYDPYSAEARAIYWRQVKERLAGYGIDAWWMDASEPDLHSNLSIEERKAIMTPTALGPGAAYFNSYPLVHASGVYEGWKAFKPDTRSFILTRSGFGGIQRTGSAIWSGDVASRWDDLRNQISAGVNFSMSGIPNWTHDIGGFANEERFTKQDPAHLAEWRELNLRWFQFGAFSPLFRSHGEFPHREIYEIAPAGSAMYRSMAYYDRLRYRLLPYIYTLAADTYFKDGTMMRGMVMDFPADPAVRDIADQYLFGHALLVAPVTRFKATSRPVYLPAGASWYDLYTGRSLAGGRTVQADAPPERMPLFVRAGSILPVGPEIQHTAEASDAPVTLVVYAGADGEFSLYEDDGTSLGYQRGAFSRIPLRWDERSGVLTIGAREGRWDGMKAQRRFNVKLISAARPSALDSGRAPDAAIAYDGGQKQVKLR